MTHDEQRKEAFCALQAPAGWLILADTIMHGPGAHAAPNAHLLDCTAHYNCNVNADVTMPASTNGRIRAIKAIVGGILQCSSHYPEQAANNRRRSPSLPLHKGLPSGHSRRMEKDSWLQHRFLYGNFNTLPSKTSVQVKVTNDTDRSATIVEVSFPDKVGGMLQMLRAVKALLLNIIRASVVTVGNVAVVRLHVVTLEGKKVTDSAILSAITPAIVGEMEGQEAMVDAALDAVEAVADGEARDLMLERYNERRDRAFTKNKVVTTVRVYPDAAHRNSVMTVQTRDRPGILVDIAKTLTDLGINIVNAEVETEDFMVRNIFFLSQGGKPLSHQMETLVTNALNFYLRTGVEDESY
eukprot:jgi/Mesvir1/21489/Mv24126-RA.1